MNNQHVRHILTRLALAVIFVGIGLWEIIQPAPWTFYVPSFFAQLVSLNVFVMAHGVLMLAIGIAVLLGVYLRLASGLAALIMLSILVDLAVMFGFTDLIIRDLSVFIIAIALFFDDTKYLRLTKK